MNTDFDIIIIGAGLVGITAAIACAQTGLSLALIDRNAPQDMPEDFRASAISPSALRMLARLHVDIEPYSEPIHDMLAYEGAQNSPWKIHFDTADKLGVMAENSHLRRVLWDRFHQLENTHLFAPAQLTGHSRDASAVKAQITQDGRLQSFNARLMIAADGRSSHIRRAAQINVQSTPYNQRALVAIIAHSLPHQGLALQRFMRGGPLAVLPLPQNRSQIVWSDKTAAIGALEQLSEADFTALLAQRMGDYLGDLTLDSPRQSYPLGLQIADKFTAERLALIGDAAHVIHPLAGQGLNLGLRDVAALAEGVGLAHKRGLDIGSSGLIDYAAWRNIDVRAMGAATHSLNMIFGLKNPILGHIRRLGLKTANEIPMLKGLFMSEAAGELGDLPAIMRM